MKYSHLAKRGNSALTFPFVIIISLVVIIISTVFSVNMILPFIWYEKLELVSYKYMYVIEKYGYLKDSERENLLEDLSEKGFDREEITINSPLSPQGYGKLVEFNVNYNYKQKLPSWKGSLKMITRIIPINVNKTIISKV